MSVNPTYQNLDAKLRVSGLTPGQWAQLISSGLAGLLFALYVSPLPVGPTLTVSVLVAGLPVAVSYGLSGAEFSATRLALAVCRWARRPSQYQAGAGAMLTGYVVQQPAPEPAPVREPQTQLDPEELWTS
jgi:hypothetical protein